MRPLRPARCAFTLLEIQVALILLTMGMMTLASLMATQSRAEKRIEAGFAPDAIIHVTQSKDPWVRKLNVPARLMIGGYSQPVPPTVTAVNDVAIIAQQNALAAETMSVTVEVTPIIP